MWCSADLWWQRYTSLFAETFLNCTPRWQTASVLLSTCGLPSALCQEAAHLREGRCLGMICMKSYPSPSECRQTENHSHRKLTNLITGPQPCLTQWNYEPCHVGLPRMVGSWWRGLTECGPLEKGMASHFIIPALRTPWTVWKGKMVVWGGLTKSCEKKRSEKQRRKGKIFPSDCRVPKNSQET